MEQQGSHMPMPQASTSTVAISADTAVYMRTTLLTHHFTTRFGHDHDHRDI